MIVSVWIVSIFYPVKAQNNNPDLQRELNLEKEYNPTLRDANKINQLPEIKEPEASETKIEFSSYTLDQNIPPYLLRLKSKTYFQNFSSSNKKGYLDLGISSIMNIDGDIGYQIIDLPADRLDIFGSHRSANSKVSFLQQSSYVNGKEKMIINDNLIGFDYMHRFKKSKLSADAQYTSSGFNYYGLPIIHTVSSTPSFDDTNNFEQSTEKQNNNLIRLHLGLTSVNRRDVDYKAHFFYTLFKQKYGELTEQKGKAENRLMADIDMHAHFNSISGIGVRSIVKNYSYSVPANWNVNNDTIFFDKNHGNYNYTVFSFNPYLTFEGIYWKTYLGVGINLQTGRIKKLFITPGVQFQYRPSDAFLLYLSAEGGLNDNCNYNLYYENRYVSPLYRIYDSKTLSDITFGIDFSPLPNLGVHLFAGYKWIADEHFFIHTNVSNMNNQYFMSQKIIPQYADAETLKIGGAFRYSYRDIFDLSLKMLYNQWNVKKLSLLVIPDYYTLGAWNKPDFTSDLNVGFKIPMIPFRMDATYHLETGRKALPEDNNPVDMKNVSFLNVQGNCTLNEYVSVFVKVNNVFFQKYDLWYGYPAQKFNLMGGINLKF
jgi:hypothetical protein